MKIQWLARAGLFLCVVASLQASTLTEDFSHDPLQNGWRVFGNSNLFQWNGTNHVLEVTWDSTNSNSYFHRSLGTVLTPDDDFSVSFDLQLKDALALGYGSELAVGLFRLSDAASPAFSRDGGAAPNLFEFNYFPDTRSVASTGDSIGVTLVDTNGDYGHMYFAWDNKTLVPGQIYHIRMGHAAGATNATCEVFTDGVLWTALPIVYSQPIDDFRFDSVSISSYQDDGLGDSILAHGTVANFSVTLPPAPVESLQLSRINGNLNLTFSGRTNWFYTLERTLDFASWISVSPTVAGIAGAMMLPDASPAGIRAFYRIRARRP